MAMYGYPFNDLAMQLAKIRSGQPQQPPQPVQGNQQPMPQPGRVNNPMMNYLNQTRFMNQILGGNNGQ